MTTELRYRIESHPTAATLYLSGPLTVAGALCAARLCDNLPTRVSDLRVDLTAVRLDDASPLQALAMRLARWRRLGDGRRTRLDLPPAPRRPRPPVPRPKPPRARRGPSRRPSRPAPPSVTSP